MTSGFLEVCLNKKYACTSVSTDACASVKYWMTLLKLISLLSTRGCLSTYRSLSAFATRCAWI